MTNGGGVTEEDKAKKLTDLFDCKILKSQILLSHTPLQELAKKYRSERVLVYASIRNR